jgi:hypothetical protein
MVAIVFPPLPHRSDRRETIDQFDPVVSSLRQGPAQKPGQLPGSPAIRPAPAGEASPGSRNASPNASTADFTRVSVPARRAKSTGWRSRLRCHKFSPSFMTFPGHRGASWGHHTLALRSHFVPQPLAGASSRVGFASAQIPRKFKSRLPIVLLLGRCSLKSRQF